MKVKDVFMEKLFSKEERDDELLVAIAKGKEYNAVYKYRSAFGGPGKLYIKYTPDNTSANESICGVFIEENGLILEDFYEFKSNESIILVNIAFEERKENEGSNDDIMERCQL